MAKKGFWDGFCNKHPYDYGPGEELLALMIFTIGLAIGCALIIGTLLIFRTMPILIGPVLFGWFILLNAKSIFWSIDENKPKPVKRESFPIADNACEKVNMDDYVDRRPKAKI